MTALQDEWTKVCAALGVDAAYAEQLWTCLAEAYSEPQRHYHTLDHIATVVADAVRLHDRFERPDAAVLALFLHDVVYDPARRDNETRSADKLEVWLGRRIDAGVLATCRRAIEATASHAPQNDPDLDLILDIDMAILGAAPEAYGRYAEGVAREYLPVYGFDTYAAGRMRLFLEPILARGSLFLTPAFAGLEAQARVNLADELAQWTSGAFARRLQSGL
jgi:predicted metal-dependent HD superfamily phosphohydrolase